MPILTSESSIIVIIIIIIIIIITLHSVCLKENFQTSKAFFSSFMTHQFKYW